MVKWNKYKGSFSVQFKIVFHAYANKADKFLFYGYSKCKIEGIK